MVLNLHLGAHKTATTHLQLSLRTVQHELRDNGVFYADPAIVRGDNFPLIQGLNAAPGQRDAERLAGRRFHHLREMYPWLLCSDENFLGGTHRDVMFGRRGEIYPQGAQRLRKLLRMAGGGPATLFLSVRDPASFNASAFSLQLILGNELMAEDYMAGRDPTSLNWTGLVRRLLSIEGAARIVVWRYEDYPRLRGRILRRMLPPHLARQVPDPAPVNEGMSQPAYEWLAEQAMTQTDADLRQLAAKSRERFPRSAGHAPMRPFRPEEHQRSQAGYGADLDRLRQMPRVEFLEPRAAAAPV